MKKSGIYTGTGDEGKTGLVSGNRIMKSDFRIDAYGDLDELNSRIGYACSYLDNNFSEEIKFLHTIQSALFDLGSNMACEFENRSKYNLPQLTDQLIKEVEAEIDRMDAQLTPLKTSFFLVVPLRHPRFILQELQLDRLKESWYTMNSRQKRSFQL